jgi:hypothetical protein
MLVREKKKKKKKKLIMMKKEGKKERRRKTTKVCQTRSFMFYQASSPLLFSKTLSYC